MSWLITRRSPVRDRLGFVDKAMPAHLFTIQGTGDEVQRSASTGKPSLKDFVSVVLVKSLPSLRTCKARAFSPLTPPRHHNVGVSYQCKLVLVLSWVDEIYKYKMLCLQDTPSSPHERNYNKGPFKLWPKAS